MILIIFFQQKYTVLWLIVCTENIVRIAGYRIYFDSSVNQLISAPQGWKNQWFLN